MKIIITTLLALASVAYGQLYFHSPIPIVYQQQSQIQVPQQVPVAHRAVIENALREAQLPQEYMNKFYKDPRIAAALAKESWFTKHEMPVLDREAEKIPRENIFKLFRNAGWIKRK